MKRWFLVILLVVFCIGFGKSVLAQNFFCATYSVLAGAGVISGLIIFVNYLFQRFKCQKQ
ncbi:MAG: hypothetical protein DRH33_05170 [Candidatus Nealsonbacteria bacterium]|nr:MAG: hypothetical protein DRH33_05170 [Candidatus Nealsonbacteria bacterium]